jgi:predicted outer membrane repeat protein
MLNAMKSRNAGKTFLKILLFLLIATQICFAQTHISAGDINGTWTSSSSPYLIEGDISIPSGQTLTIEPGVLVEFQGHYTLFVQGRLVAVGTETDNITFTINDTTGFYDPNSPLGSWYGIRFVNTPIQNDSSKIIYCKLQYGKALGTEWYMNAGGAVCSIDFDKIIISNSLFSNCSATRSGGAIFTWQSDLSIDNCEFNNDLTINYGGAIRCDSSSITITNSDFNQNLALWGGAIFNLNSEIYLQHCSFAGNYSEHGGAIYSNTGSLDLKNVAIVQNSSNFGGGIGALNTNIEIDSCLFSQNSVNNNSGAIDYDIDPNVSSNCQFKVVNSGFTENSAVQYYGCIKIQQPDNLSSLVNVFIDKCKFENSSADRTGAIRLDGNIWDFVISNSLFRDNIVGTQSACSFWRGSRGKIVNCLFDSNIAQTGLGSLALSNSSSVDLINCTIVNNIGVGSGGLRLQQSSSKVINSIFWGNYPDQISIQSSNNTNISMLYVDYNDIQFGIDSIRINDTFSVLNWGTGNIDSYPLFLDTLNNDYHLQDLSPCIATGIDSIEILGMWYYCPSTDIEGNPRPNPAGSKPDMGAFESQYLVQVEEKGSSLPTLFELFQNYPNPFNPSTKIKYSVPHSSNVVIKIFDILGREIQMLVNEEEPVGTYEISWNAANLPSGIYFYQLKAGSYLNTRKTILLK